MSYQNLVEKLYEAIEKQASDDNTELSQTNSNTAFFKDNSMNIILAFKGAEMMNSRNFDKELEEIIKNLYGKTYKIKYIEKIDEEEVRKSEERAIQAQKIAIKRAQQEAQAALDAQNEINNNKEENKINSDNILNT